MKMESSVEGAIPNELREPLGNFDAAISELETMLQPLLSTSRSEIVEKIQPLDAAKLDLVGVYSLNSLFWMYLNVCGVNPKDHGVKGELERIRAYMTRIKEAQEELSKPRQRVDKSAAERFIRRNLPRNALWENSLKKAAEDSKTRTALGSEPQEEDSKPRSKKRKQKAKD